MDSTSTVTGFVEKRIKKIIRARQDATGKVEPQLRLQESHTMAKDEAPKVPRTCIAKPLTSCSPFDFAERQTNKPSTLTPSIQAALKQARETLLKPLKRSDKEDRADMLDLDPGSGESEKVAKKESSAISGSDEHEAIQLEQCNDCTEIGDSQDSTMRDPEAIQPKEVELALKTNDYSESAIPESSTTQATSCEGAAETTDSTVPTSPLWDAVQSEEFEQALDTDDSSESEASEIWECVSSARIAADHESSYRNKSQNRRQKIFERPQELDSMIGALELGSDHLETAED